MPAKTTIKVTPMEYVTIEVAVPKELLNAVIAAINSIVDQPETVLENLPPALVMVPESTQVPKATPSSIRTRPASPLDLAKLADHPSFRVATSKSSTLASGCPKPGNLAERAPSPSIRDEFDLGFIKGTPPELKSIADQVIEKMGWLIGLMPDPDYVRKGLRAESEKTTGNPNHGALVALSQAQQELHRQEALYNRQRSAFHGLTPLAPSAETPTNNGWGATQRKLSPEDLAAAEVQSAAALAAKNGTIGKANAQFAAAPRGASVAGVGGSGTKSARTAQKSAKK